jgi:tRNA A-37 threonylcarbamoyl transferase component Bud32
MLEKQKVEAQQALDELFSEHLLPFELTAHKLESIGSGEYIVRFHDSRLTSIDVSWVQGQSFKDVVRTAVLARVGRMSGRLKRTAKRGSN